MNNNYNNFYPYGYQNMTRGIPNANMMFNPSYMASMPTRASGGLLSRLFPTSLNASSSIGAVSGATTSGVTFSGILNGASKTLGVINQAIPVFYQMKPIWNNAKTMFRVAKAMKDVDTPITKESVNEVRNSFNNEETKKSINDNQPTFFN